MNKLVLAVAILSLLITACGEAPPEEQAEIARPVKIFSYGGEAGGLTLEYSGTVAAAQRSDMGFEVQGRVTEFLASSGEAVTEGQVLARLDPVDYQAELDKVQADLRQNDIESKVSEPVR